ncbi:MAG: protein of unknown function with transrane region [Parcubacteria group bacterium]|nr:protein of unknown function with transrane region [Parcubacteria group bacterium]
MTIAEMREVSNKALAGVPKDVLVVGVVVLASTASFGLGILAGRDTAGKGNEKNAGFWVEDVSATTSARLPAAAAAAGQADTSAVVPPRIPVVAAGTVITPMEGKYVASKTGKKYYLPSCSGAKRIKETNKVWFASVADAQAAGLTPASNCPGL